MSESVRVVVMVAAALLLVAGAAVEVHAIRHYRSETMPRVPSFNPRNWMVRREWFRDERGYRFDNTARWLMFSGGLLGWIVYVF